MNMATNPLSTPELFWVFISSAIRHLFDLSFHYISLTISSPDCMERSGMQSGAAPFSVLVYLHYIEAATY